MVPTSPAMLLGTQSCVEFDFGIWMVRLVTSLRSCGFSTPLVRVRVSRAISTPSLVCMLPMRLSLHPTCFFLIHPPLIRRFLFLRRKPLLCTPGIGLVRPCLPCTSHLRTSCHMTRSVLTVRMSHCRSTDVSGCFGLLALFPASRGCCLRLLLILLTPSFILL